MIARLISVARLNDELSMYARIDFNEPSIDMFHKRVPKACWEVFVTIETSLGRPVFVGLFPGAVYLFVDRASRDLVRKASANVRGSCPRACVFVSVGPTVSSDPNFSRVFSCRAYKAVVMATVGVLCWSRWAKMEC
ncbi:hypothetical protein CRG98_042723 [Punica granatum]|uniref:Uncharacterized protein n=1 Tax=Punica granatum TaxID=22663 RepID=A0A2I0HYV8_PUNGR|nr:hypothetical protein CRG98_042723 [Punica granatum]